jgi:Glycosyltransferase family 87
VAALLVGGYFALLAALGGYWQFSRFMPVGSQGVAVQDFRDLTSAWDCARRGIAVLPVNPCAPVPNAAANWPRLWLLPYHLGLGEGDTIPLAVTVFVVVFIVAVLVLPASAGLFAGAVYGLALCSSAVMLGVYWGNIDLVVFILVASAALLLRRLRVGLIAGELLLLLASLLKLFPIVAVCAILRHRSRVARVGALAIVACFAAYVLANYSYLALGLRRTAQSDSMTFGMRRFTEWAVAGVNTISPRIAAGVNTHLTPRAWDVGAAILVVLALAAFQRRLHSHLPPGETAESQRDLDLFWVGASIYVFSYVVIRSWDYRLVFTLLTIPQLFRWVSMKRALAVVTLLALFCTLWIELAPPVSEHFIDTAITSPFSDLTSIPPFHEPLLPGVFAQLVLFVGLLAGMVATTPAGWLEAARGLFVTRALPVVLAKRL